MRACSSGRFRSPAPGEATPLAEIDYALRWNVGAYRSLLIGQAQKMGVQYVEGEVARSLEITPALHRGRTGLWARIRQAAVYFVVGVLDYRVTRRLNIDVED